MCNFMKTVLTLLIFIISSNIFAMQDQEAAAEESVKPLRIVFYIDDHNEKFGRNGSDAATCEFARTLSQCKSCVVIVSNYVLKNMILRKYTKNPAPFLESLDLNLNDWGIYQVNNTQFFVFVPHGYDYSMLNKKLWTKIDLSAGDEYKGEPDTILGKLLGAVNRFPIIPWADGSPIEAKRLLSNKVLKYIPYAKDTKTDVKDLLSPEHKKFEPTQLSLIFTPPAKKIKAVIIDKKPFEYELYKLSSLPPCNICIFGHGGYSSKKENITIAGMPVDYIVNTLLFFNDKLNTKSVRITSCYSGGKNLDLMRIKNNIPIRTKYILIADSITDTTTFNASSKKTINFNRLDHYFDALDRFQDSYSTFSNQVKAIKSKGTEHAAIKEALKKLEKNNGLNGILQNLLLFKVWYFLPNGPSNFPQIWIPEVGWFQTFNINPDIQKITDATIIKALARPEFIKNEEVEIEDVRKTPPQGKKVIIKSRLKKMDFTAAGAIEINKKLALLLYSEIVFADLNIIPEAKIKTSDLCKGNITWWLVNTYKYFPSIPCLDTIYSNNPIERNFYIYPEIISMQRGDSVNLFAKIKILNAGEIPIETGILNFLRDSFLILRGRKSEKTFFIKELEGFNDFSQILDEKDDFKKFLKSKNIEQQQIILNNVFIKTSSVQLDETILNVEISFEFEGKYWILKNLDMEFYFDQKPNLPTNKSQSLWHFENSKDKYEEYLTKSKLKFLAELTPSEYYAQLPIIRDMFQNKNTNIKIKNPSSVLSLKDFFLGLTPEDVEKIREFTNYEQPTKLKIKLKKLKTSLDTLKQKLLMLNLKLEQLKDRLTGTA